MKFSFENLRGQFNLAKSLGYSFMTCREWALSPKDVIHDKLIITRIDIDESVTRLPQLLEILLGVNAKATIFVRLHAEYNPFSFENYQILRSAISCGHEIAYHSEVVDQAAIWGEAEITCLLKDIRVLSDMLSYDVVGVASHGGRTGLNNLDFWRHRTATDFGLLYEGYDETPTFGLFKNSLYISDSEWVRWKCYRQGVLQVGDDRSLGEHLEDRPPLIYLLIHPETFYHRHPYE